MNYVFKRFSLFLLILIQISLIHIALADDIKLSLSGNLTDIDLSTIYIGGNNNFEYISIENYDLLKKTHIGEPTWKILNDVSDFASVTLSSHNENDPSYITIEIIPYKEGFIDIELECTWQNDVKIYTIHREIQKLTVVPTDMQIDSDFYSLCIGDTFSLKSPTFLPSNVDSSLFDVLFEIQLDPNYSSFKDVKDFSFFREQYSDFLDNLSPDDLVNFTPLDLLPFDIEETEQPDFFEKYYPYFLDIHQKLDDFESNTLTAIIPGYYSIWIKAYFANFFFRKECIIAVRNPDGSFPARRDFQFILDEKEITLQVGNTLSKNSIIFSPIFTYSDYDSYSIIYNGLPQWGIRHVSGPVLDISLDQSDSSHKSVNVILNNAPLEAGISEYELSCTWDGVVQTEILTLNSVETDLYISGISDIPSVITITEGDYLHLPKPSPILSDGSKVSPSQATYDFWSSSNSFNSSIIDFENPEEWTLLPPAGIYSLTIYTHSYGIDFEQNLSVIVQKKDDSSSHSLTKHSPTKYQGDIGDHTFYLNQDIAYLYLFAEDPYPNETYTTFITLLEGDSVTATSEINNPFAEYNENANVLICVYPEKTGISSWRLYVVADNGDTFTHDFTFSVIDNQNIAQKIDFNGMLLTLKKNENFYLNIDQYLYPENSSLPENAEIELFCPDDSISYERLEDDTLKITALSESAFGSYISIYDSNPYYNLISDDIAILIEDDYGNAPIPTESLDIQFIQREIWSDEEFYLDFYSSNNIGKLSTQIKVTDQNGIDVSDQFSDETFNGYYCSYYCDGLSQGTYTVYVTAKDLVNREVDDLIFYFTVQ